MPENEADTLVWLKFWQPKLKTLQLGSTQHRAGFTLHSNPGCDWRLCDER